MEPGATAKPTDLNQIGSTDSFQATGDPALMEAADRGESKLLGYTELYELWERQQWQTQTLDFSRDREDWQAMDAEEQLARTSGLSAFFLGEQRVADELGPIMRAAQTEPQRIFLATQIADEARHVRFFDCFYEEVGVFADAGDLPARLVEGEKHVNDAFRTLFDEQLRSRVDRLGAEPTDTVTLVEAVTLYHMVIEGMLALTGQHLIITYNEQQGTLPGFVEGFTNVARDEHRHVAFGARFLAEMAAESDQYREAIQRTLTESLPVADKVLDPPFVEEGEDWELFGTSKEETHAFAAQALTRRLKVIGLIS